MPSSLPEIRENEAPPEIAAIYDEFKRATGLPVVYTIYRHLATLPGTLPWVWDLMRDPILAGQVEQALQRLAASLQVPKPDASAAGEMALQPSAIPSIRAVLDFYERGNILNLVCLTAVLSVLDNPGHGAASAPASARASPRIAASRADLPGIHPLPKLAELSPAVSALVWSFVDLHEGASTAGLTPGLYLHLAQWPEFLGVVRAPLAARFADGSVERTRAELVRVAKEEAHVIATGMRSDRPRPVGECLEAMRRALEGFTERFIPTMVVVGRIFRGPLPLL